jgi:membrane associated rhomboid family serine protease
MNLRQSFLLVGSLVVLMWLTFLVDALFDLELYRFGVYPRRWDGLVGVLCAPFIHGSFRHLFSNTLPMLVLGTAIVYGYPRASKFAVPIIYLASGIGVWLFARTSYHIGASGLTFGFMFFVFTIGALRWEPRAIALSCLVFFLYGGMVWGVFPGVPGVSFETHLFGAVAGVMCAALFRRFDRVTPRRRYDWETETDEAVDPLIGDEWRDQQGRENDR